MPCLRLFSALHCAVRIFIICATAAAAGAQSYDVVVYGGSSAGVTAAIQAARMGRTTVLVTAGTHVGGMTASGLSSTDVGNATTIGGLAAAFYVNVHEYYHPETNRAVEKEQSAAVPNSLIAYSVSSGPSFQFTFEPHVAEAIFVAMLRGAGATLVTNAALDRVTGVILSGPRIVALRTRDGRIIHGRVFIDATYEGDLLAAVGVPYRLGREDRAEFGESLAGVYPDAELTGEVDPFRIAGAPTSGLLPGVSPFVPGPPGAGDGRVQQYNLRLCVTRDPANRVPFEKPASYDPADYELLRRRLVSNPRYNLGDVLKLGSIPGGKADLNANGSFSTDLAGEESTQWTTASDERRADILRRFRDYTAGLFWFLAHDPTLPEHIRDAAASWGLAADEFADNAHWPWQLYVRESRRMLGAYTITQQDCDGTRLAPDSVALASYPIDSHKVTLFVDTTGRLATEGYFFRGVEPWPISYRALVPPLGLCDNLIVPICVSASHVAFNSIRMEPVYLMLGQAAGTAAALAVETDVAVQRIDYRDLAAQLRADGQVLYWTRMPRTAARLFEDVGVEAIESRPRTRPYTTTHPPQLN